MKLHPRLQEIRLLAFDLDGTLIDSVPDLTTAVDQALKQMHLPLAGPGQVRHWVGNGSQVLIQRAVTGQDQGEKLIAADDPRVIQAHDLFLEAYAATQGEATRLYPGVLETLDQLSRLPLPLALITNKPARFLPELLAGLGIDHYFQLLLGGDSLAQKKPHPAPLLHAAEHFACPPKAAALVGDSRHDIEAARAAGFISVGVPYGYNHGQPISQSQPDLLINHLTDLLN
ncbi:phosphoglycolate phosphatase [Marinospirillum perlucidum]|uniref:phosphoglycolate phosphatase n=1 Tax=Marinospirillum perlucidum TaxID=1982602 RepID=UPI000DF32793|nr:phosphoglycolate phosphatase [Marinospirillum perlucidum]